MVGGGCELDCAFCDCHAQPSDPFRIDGALRRGGARLDLRGGTRDATRTSALIRRARDAGFGELVLRTSALAWQRPEAATALAGDGVHAVLVPIFSEHAAVHDRIAKRPDALVQALVGLRALAAAGLAIEIEVPLLSPRLQDPAALVALVHRAVPSLRAVHFFVPRRPVPAPLAPPRWGEGAPRLAAALAACRALGVSAALPGRNAVPLCALRAYPDVQDAHRFAPWTPAPPVDGCAVAPACAGCAARAQCPGVAGAYAAVHGAADIAPYARRPRRLYDQRTTRTREWTEAQRDAARQLRWLVLRPTVNCNQDCVFCSVNETARNVWADPGAVLRGIARAGRRGVARVCFTGGEPTLSPHLATYIAAARRCGIAEADICTNGVLLDTAPRVERLVAAGLTHAFVSLHAHDEALSRTTTLKEDDLARTVRAAGHLLDAGIVVTLNHVVHARNHRYLTRFVEFVHARYGGRALLAFTFITPQYKALEHFELVPRISDVIPHLKRAARRALALGQPFYISARQGIPPCFLGEFRAWSDLAGVFTEAVAEDGPQKRRAPQCDRCRYTRHCTGLWAPYVDRYGLDELVPVEGPAFTPGELLSIRGNSPDVNTFPRSFDAVPEHLRVRSLEPCAPPACEDPPDPPDPPELITGGVEPLRRVRLPVLAADRTRPARLVVLGSGPRARHLVAAARGVRGLSVDAVASPHALDTDPRDLGGCPRFRDAAEALDAMRPDAVVIVAATRTHAALARLALAQGIPTLIEQPVTDDDTLADALCTEARQRGTVLMPVHDSLFAPGFDGLDAAPPGVPVRCAHHAAARAPGTPTAWERAGVYALLYRVLVLAGRAAGGGVGHVTEVHLQGDARPERLRAVLMYPRTRVDVALDLLAPQAESTVVIGPRSWRHAGEPPLADSAASPLVRLLSHFSDVVLGRAAPRLDITEALDVRRTAGAWLVALGQAGAPFDRPEAPRHVASRALAARFP